MENTTQFNLCLYYQKKFIHEKNITRGCMVPWNSYNLVKTQSPMFVCIVNNSKK